MQPAATTTVLLDLRLGAQVTPLHEKTHQIFDSSPAGRLCETYEVVLAKSWSTVHTAKALRSHRPRTPDCSWSARPMVYLHMFELIRGVRDCTKLWHHSLPTSSVNRTTPAPHISTGSARYPPDEFNYEFKPVSCEVTELLG